MHKKPPLYAFDLSILKVYGEFPSLTSPRGGWKFKKAAKKVGCPG
jgi:hypothetical protein